MILMRSHLEKKNHEIVGMNNKGNAYVFQYIVD